MSGARDGPRQVSCRSHPAVEKIETTHQAGVPHFFGRTHRRCALPNERGHCALHQNTKVKALFSPWAVHDSVDNRVGNRSEPHPAWAPLRCSWNGQSAAAARFICRLGGRASPTQWLASGDGLSPLRMVITWNGQATAQSLQPVHRSASCSTACFFHCATSKLSRWESQAATHQPQPVQREMSMAGVQPGRGRPAGRCGVTRIATTADGAGATPAGGYRAGRECWQPRRIGSRGRRASPSPSGSGRPQACRRAAGGSARGHCWQGGRHSRSWG